MSNQSKTRLKCTVLKQDVYTVTFSFTEQFEPPPKAYYSFKTKGKVEFSWHSPETKPIRYALFAEVKGETKLITMIPSTRNNFSFASPMLRIVNLSTVKFFIGSVYRTNSVGVLTQCQSQ